MVDLKGCKGWKCPGVLCIYHVRPLHPSEKGQACPLELLLFAPPRNDLGATRHGYKMPPSPPRRVNQCCFPPKSGHSKKRPPRRLNLGEVTRHGSERPVCPFSGSEETRHGGYATPACPFLEGNFVASLGCSKKWPNVATKNSHVGEAAAGGRTPGYVPLAQH